MVGASSSRSVRTSTTAAISLGRGMSQWASQLLRTASGQPAPSVAWTTKTCLQGISLLYLTYSAFGPLGILTRSTPAAELINAQGMQDAIIANNNNLPE